MQPKNTALKKKLTIGGLVSSGINKLGSTISKYTPQTIRDVQRGEDATATTNAFKLAHPKPRGPRV